MLLIYSIQKQLSIEILMFCESKPMHAENRMKPAWIPRVGVLSAGSIIVLLTFLSLNLCMGALVTGKSIKPINYLVLVVLFVMSFASVYSGISGSFRKLLKWMMLSVLAFILAVCLFFLWLLSQSSDTSGLMGILVVFSYLGAVAGLCLISYISLVVWMRRAPTVDEKPDYRKFAIWGFIYFVSLSAISGSYNSYTKRQIPTVSEQQAIQKSEPRFSRTPTSVESIPAQGEALTTPSLESSAEAPEAEHNSTPDIDESTGMNEPETVAEPQEDNFPHDVLEAQRQQRGWKEQDFSDVFRFEQTDGQNQMLVLYTQEQSVQGWVPETIRLYMTQHMPKEIVTDVARIGEDDWLFISNPRWYEMSTISRLYKGQVKRKHAESLAQLICIYGLGEISFYQEGVELKVKASCLRYEGAGKRPSIIDRWTGVWRGQQFVTEERYPDLVPHAKDTH